MRVCVIEWKPSFQFWTFFSFFLLNVVNSSSLIAIISRNVVNKNIYSRALFRKRLKHLLPQQLCASGCILCRSKMSMGLSHASHHYESFHLPFVYSVNIHFEIKRSEKVCQSSHCEKSIAMLRVLLFFPCLQMFLPGSCLTWTQFHQVLPHVLYVHLRELSIFLHQPASCCLFHMLIHNTLFFSIGPLIRYFINRYFSLPSINTFNNLPCLLTVPDFNNFFQLT